MSTKYFGNREIVFCLSVCLLTDRQTNKRHRFYLPPWQVGDNEYCIAHTCTTSYDKERIPVQGIFTISNAQVLGGCSTEVLL